MSLSALNNIETRSMVGTNHHLPISVVILTKNSAKTIYDCLNSIIKNSPSEIIVVDGGSTDKTLEIAGTFTNKIIYDQGRGKSFARWLGAKQSTAEFVAYVDSDIVIPRNALETMLRELTAYNCTAISSPTYLHNRKEATYWSKSADLHNYFTRHLVHRSILGTRCCLIRREVLLSYGFDFSHKGTMDDYDLTLRLLRDNRVLCWSSVKAFDEKNEDFWQFISYHFFLGQVSYGYLRKYGLTQIRRFPLLSTLYWTFYALFTGNWRLIPYFIVKGLVETAGLLAGSQLKRT